MYNTKIENDHSKTILDFKNKESFEKAKEKIKEIQLNSSRSGADKYIIEKNNVLLNKLIEGGLINFSKKVYCFPFNGKTFNFVKNRKICYKELII